jgi:hypothetical protein
MSFHKMASVVLALSSAVFLTPAAADPDKDESGHGRHSHRPAKQEYWDGTCKVERKWEGNGEYKEERKCRGGRHYSASVPAEPYPQAEPGVVITVPPIVIPLPAR